METKNIFSYNGNKVTFKQDGKLMVNATQMAKPFGRQPAHWLNNSQTKEYLVELSKIRNLILTDLVYVKSGGANPGTWLHEDVALEFARWLSPEFAIWCNDRIKELLSTGTVSLQSEDELILSAMHTLSQRVDQQKEQLRLAQSTIQAQAPKVQYCNEVLQSQSTLTTTIIAKELGMGAPTLHRLLNEKKVIYKHHDTWVLYYDYQNRGLAKTRTYAYTDSEGRSRTSIQLVWTEKGRQLIHQLLSVAAEL